MLFLTQDFSLKTLSDFNNKFPMFFYSDDVRKFAFALYEKTKHNI